MEVWLAGGFLPLLLLSWLLTGLTHQISATIDVSVGLDLVLQCVLQAGLSSTAGEVKWFNSTRNNGEKQNEGDVEMKNGSTQLIFTSVNKEHTGTYTCRMGNTTKVSKNVRVRSNGDGTARQPKESKITTECTFKIWSENRMVHVELYKCAGPGVGSQSNTMALGENCASLTSPSVHAANTGICGCGVFVARSNLTDAGNGSAASQTDVIRETWTGLNSLLCVTFGLAVGSLIYMPILALLLWQRRRNRKGKLESRQVAEGNQLSTAALVTGTKNPIYTNLEFEKKGTNPTSCDVVYAEIKLGQPKQSGGDAGAASAGVDVSPEGEGK